MTKPDLQVGIVAVRRADLLGETLESFSKNLFAYFNVTKCFVNIDPMFGDQLAYDETEACTRQFFPEAVVRAPSTPSFGAAVKWVWSKFSPGLALHLEDDWRLTQPILPNDVFSEMRPGYGAVTLCGNHPKWRKRRPYVWVGQRRQGFLPFGSKKIPAMGTSPKFIDGVLANRLAQLIDPELDPEKQMLPWVNPEFSKIIVDNKCAFLKKAGNRQYGVMEELGRAWREARRIEKTVKDGKSSWEVKPN